MRICLIGAGRIGAVHAIAIASEEGATLHSVVDLNREAAENLAAQYSAEVLSIDEVFINSEIDAFIIASSTATHADLIERCAQAGKPVFCDIDKENWCSDSVSIEESITDKTKAIIVVDLFGNMPHMDKIINISKKYDIPLIEDAAEALGSKYKGIRAGKFGIGSVFSFHRTKTLTTGEGGMLLLDDEELYKKCMIWRDHGRDAALPPHMRNPNTKMYFNEYVTYKYMPFNLQAAVGYAQFQRIDELVGRKRYQLEFYRNELSDIENLKFNEESDIVYNGAWITSMIIGKSYNIDKETFISKMSKIDIPIRPFFYPLSMLPPFNIKENEYKNPNSYDVSNRGVNLPGSARLNDDDMKFICDGIRKVLK